MIRYTETNEADDDDDDRTLERHSLIRVIYRKRLSIRRSLSIYS